MERVYGGGTGYRENGCDISGNGGSAECGNAVSAAVKNDAVRNALIRTDRLTLEPLCRRHFEGARLYSLDQENSGMMCFLPCDDEKEVMDYLLKCEAQWQKEKPDYLDAAVILDGTHIGAVSIELLENGTVGELGWIINKRFWGRGYAAESAEAFIGYISERFGISRFIGHADSENRASRRAMEKLGMKLVKEYGGRKNRGSDEERRECLYEMFL